MNQNTSNQDAVLAPVQRTNAVPLYHQIYLGLRDEIMHGRMAFGSALPTEHELAALHGVSRITARRALHELAESGLVERRRRTGTRVVFRSRAVPLENNVDQALESLLAFGRNTQVKVIDIVMEPSPSFVASALEREEGAPVIRARRVRQLDRKPLGVVTSYVPADLGIKLTKKALTENPMLDVLRSAGFAACGGRQIISADHANPETSSLLALEPRAALLRIERVVIGEDGRPILLTIADYRGDSYRLSLDLQASSRPRLD